MRINPYEDFESILKLLPKDKVKFTHNKNESWETTLTNCVKTYKILETFNRKYYYNSEKYNLLYKTKMLYHIHSVKIEYDPTTFTFIIYAGTTFSGGDMEFKNRGVDFNPSLGVQLDILLKEMNRELPTIRSKEIMLKIEKLALS